MASDGQTVVEVRDLAVRYGRLTGLQQLDLTLQQGEISLVLGANGAGKTSALRGICGDVARAAGSVTLRGRDLGRRPAWWAARAGMVLVPEGRQIVAPLTVAENLLLGGYPNRSASSRAAIQQEVYDLFPVLHDRRDAPGGLLSGGEQQLLAFGRAMMADPAVVLLDEPSMGLAPVMVDRVLGAVVDIAARGIAVLMVEQNAGALDIAHHARVLEQGRVVLQGPAEQLRDDPAVTAAFLGVAVV